MADYLSFCVAPAILFYQVYFDVAPTPLGTLPQDLLVGFAAGLLVGFGLLRLARHVAKEGAAAGRFTGLPTTAAGLFTTLLVAVGGLGDVFSAALVAAMALLMVTEIPYPKVRGRLAVASGALIAAPVAVLLVLPPGDGMRDFVLLASLAGASAYATSGLCFALLRIPVGKPEKPPSPSAAPARADASQEVDPDA